MIPFPCEIIPMTVTRERTVSFAITVKDESENTYTLNDGETLVFALKKDPLTATADITEEPILLTKELAETEGGYLLVIRPDDTTDLEPGRYCYDVHIESGDDRIPVIEISPFILKANVG